MTREEAIRIIREIQFPTNGDNKAERDSAIEMAIKALEQKEGHWISHREHCENLGVMPSGLGAYEWCSNCDCGIDVREWHRNHYNYCPNCGCRMVEPQERSEE